jgi:SPP1 gp7 family putative phage head morphogenesis protein
MTEPIDAYAAVETLRAQLLARERGAATRLVRAYGDVYRRLQSSIAALDSEIALLSQTGEASYSRVLKLRRLKDLRTQIETEIGHFAAYAEGEIRQGATDAIALGMQHAEAMTQAALPGLGPLDTAIMGSWQRLDPRAFEAILGFLADDSPLMTGMREMLGAAVADNVAQKLAEGLALGYNPRKVARIVQRELGMGLDSALRTARTVQLNAYREATRASYMANPRIVKGWRWHATRDQRTCMSCIAMDGTIHKVDERLNDHWNGRCVALPITPTYRELGFNVDEPDRQTETARQWFEAQPEGAQRAQMGKGKFEAWKAGAFDLGDLSVETADVVWGSMRVERTLKDLMPAERAA